MSTTPDIAARVAALRRELAVVRQTLACTEAAHKAVCREASELEREVFRLRGERDSAAWTAERRAAELKRLRMGRELALADAPGGPR